MAYGFAVSTNGLDAATVNVGDGAAFGVDNYDILTVLDLLTRTNARAKNGLLWDANSNGSFSTAESLLRSQALSLFSNINNT